MHAGQMRRGAHGRHSVVPMRTVGTSFNVRDNQRDDDVRFRLRNARSAVYRRCLEPTCIRGQTNAAIDCTHFLDDLPGTIGTPAVHHDQFIIQIFIRWDQ